ncbi:T9SS type A sorting domain-containing protein [bacterium]|nr:T9SS type A sorting domain-containing protein [bacterium]
MLKKINPLTHNQRVILLCTQPTPKKKVIILSFGVRKPKLLGLLFWLSTASFAYIASNVSIYNLVGAKVIDIDESNSIDISNLVNGTYVAVITDGINTSTSKFIKQ